MKKLVFLIFILAFLLFPSLSLADSMEFPSASPLPSTVDYPLPYPGILPNSPIYPFKVLRDRLVEFFISDPLKRAEFYLLEGDKHLAAAQVLVSQNTKNFDLAESTVSKGENYMQLSLNQIPTIKDLQVSEKDLLNRLDTALEKHDLVIKGLEKDAPADVKSGLENSRSRIKNMQKQVEQLKQKEQSLK